MHCYLGHLWQRSGRHKSLIEGCLLRENDSNQNFCFPLKTTVGPEICDQVDSVIYPTLSFAVPVSYFSSRKTDGLIITCRDDWFLIFLCISKLYFTIIDSSDFQSKVSRYNLFTRFKSFDKK